MRINISIPDELHAEIKAVTDTGDADSVSGFIATAVRRSLSYAKDSRTMDELFGPASPDEQALIDRIRQTGHTGHAA